MRSRASSIKWEYPLLSLKSSSSFLRLLPRLLATSISPFIFPSITCFRRQFLRKMCPIQLAFRFLISCRMFLCSFYVRKMLTAWKWSNKIKKIGSHLWYNGMCLDSYRCLLKLCKGSLAAWTWMMYTDAEIDWYSSNRLHACYLICHVIVSFCCRRMYCIALLQGKLYLFLGEQ